jgi:alpha-L-rhamnosidase
MMALSTSMMFAELVPLDLQADGLSEMSAVTSKPKFSWRVESTERMQAQSAWRILVASSAEILAKDQGDLWDSGKQKNARSPFVAYAGKPLIAGGVYHWKVRCWDDADKGSSWSKTAVIEIAPMSPADWQGARWIDDGRDNPTDDKDFYQPDPAPLLRKEFKIAKPIVRARLHVAGLGYALPSLNGKRLADAPLDPPWTAFDKRILFRSHDVTAALKEGENCIGLALGNGCTIPYPCACGGIAIFAVAWQSGVHERLLVW